MKVEQEFYGLGSPLGETPGRQFLYGDPRWYEKYKHAEWTEEMDFEQMTCPLEPRKHMRAGRRLGGLQVVLPSLKFGDFVWTWYSEPIVAHRVRTLFEGAGFSGLEFRPVTIRKVRHMRRIVANQLPVLWELLVTGSGGEAHPSSGIRLLYKCPACGLEEYSSFRNGIVVDTDRWDSSDFFTVAGYPKFILITERAKDLVVRNKLTNCSIVRARDLQWGDNFRPEDHPEHFMSGPQDPAR